MAWAGLAFKQGFVATKTLEELMWKVKHSADFLLNSYVSENPPIFMASYGNSTQCVCGAVHGHAHALLKGAAPVPRAFFLE